MASKYQLGYDDKRFPEKVDQNFHCSICYNVLKDPVMCRRKKHHFCRGCITEHLRRNSRTCPTCADELSVDTLVEVPRIVKNYLDQREICCDHYDRGCRELVQLQHLKRHVDECGFTPVVCGNQGCGEAISKRDRTYHESELCQYRKLKCHNCGEISTMMAGMKVEVANLNTNQATTNTNIATMKTEIENVNTQLENISTKLANVEMKFEAMNTETRGMKMSLSDTTSGGREHQHIFVASGGGKDSVEIFNCHQRVWSLLKPMPENRHSASVFVYNNHVTVAGGCCGLPVDDMIQMKIHPVPDLTTNWSDFEAKLPARMYGHSSVVYKDSLLVTGGYNEDQRAVSDCIHKVQLKQPHVVELMSNMPEPRICHSTVLCDDSILIFGGRKSRNCKDNLCSVLSYDIKTNRCRQLPALPYPVSEMATVKLAENVVIIGGADKDNKPLNSVIIYNIKTGNSHMLPPMLHKRSDCTAVVVENTIVVLGGMNARWNCLKSVEDFTFDRYSWEELPPMKKARKAATAVVI